MVSLRRLRLGRALGLRLVKETHANRCHPLLGLSWNFVALLLLLPLMSSHTETLYTRIYVVFYEERRLEAVKGDLQQAAQSLKSVVEYEPLKVPPDGDLGRALKLVRQGRSVRLLLGCAR